ncbi:MAG: ferrous iron transport protein A [Firmicutes bacterium]|nr:ferrous iron transport protein A [Bacillota bacterium]
MTLDRVRRGQVLRIARLPEGIFRAQALRFDLGEGAVVTCREVIPAGPVVLARRRQEVAIGRDLARRITVEPLR